MNEENKITEEIAEEKKSAVEENFGSEETSASEEKNETDAEKSEEKPKKKTKGKKKKGRLKAAFTSKKAKHGSVAVGITVAVIAVVVILNIICGLLVDKFPDIKLDMTANNSYALEEDTVDYVSHLSKDVNLYILMTKTEFESGGSYLIQAENLLEKMVSNSGGKLSLEYVDLSENPTFTSNYTDIDWSSSSSYMMLVESGDSYKALSLSDLFEYDEEYYYYYGELSITGTTVEQAVVTSILNVTTEDKVVVDVITGNEEGDYSAIVSLLENNAYNVNEVSLLTGEIDEDAEIVVLYAPSVDLDESAIEKLSQWLDNDGDYGKNLVYIPTSSKTDTPNLDAFLDEWGMEVESGYLFETNGNYLVSNSTPYAFIVDYTDYYTTDLKNSSIPVVVTNSRAITVTDDSVAHGILTTGSGAGIYPFDADESWNYEDAVSQDALNAAAEGVKTNSDDASSSVIVFGSDSMFSSDIMSYNSYNNSAYLMNVINTAADKDDTEITIESKSLDSTELGSISSTTIVIAYIVFVVVIPLIVIIIGLVMWIRRRHR